MIFVRIGDAAGAGGEWALAIDRGRARRVLVAPALFDEASKLRRFAVETMRRLDAAGIDSLLPDLPGTNDSLADPAAVDLAGWAAALTAAAGAFGATHALGLRGGGLLVPAALPGWLYAPVKGANLLRTLLRAAVLTEREAGRETTSEALLAHGQREGLRLGGFALSPAMVRQLLAAIPQERPDLPAIAPAALGAAALWLRAEPGDDPAGSAALAAQLAADLGP